MAFTKDPQPKDEFDSPITNLVRAYEPLIYEATFDNVGYTIPPRASIQLNINGFDFGSPKDITPISNVGTLYTFRFDIADRVQEFMDNQASLIPFTGYIRTTPPPNLDESSPFYQKVCNFQVFATFYVASGGGGAYQASGTPEESVKLYAINARANQESTLTLLPFVAPTIAAKRRYLTNSPSLQALRRNDSYYLSYWCAGSEGANQAAKIKAYNDAGALLQTGYYELDEADVSRLNRVRMIPVGAANINTTLTAQFIGGNRVTINGAVARYTVQVGTYDKINDIFTPQFQLRTFIIDNDACDYVRVFFLNEYGGLDAYNFSYDNANDTEDITVAKYRKNVNTFPRFGDRGAVDLSASRQRNLSLFTNLSEQETAWLMELSSSVLIASEYNPNPRAATPLRAMVLAGAPRVVYQSREEDLIEYELPLAYAYLNQSQNS